MKRRTKRPGIEERSPTFRLLYYWGKLLGINPLSLSNTNKLEFSYLSLVYGCSLGTIYCYSFYRALVSRLEYYLPTETPVARIANVIGICCQFAETSLMWFLFAIRQNNIARLLKSLAKAERLSTKLGIPDECDKNLRKFGISVTINNLVYLASLSYSHAMLHYYPNYNDSLFIAFNVARVASFNAEVLFLCSVLGVGGKFRRLNEKVGSLMRDGRSEDGETNARVSSGSTRNSRSVLLPERILLVAQLHRQLRHLLHGVVGHFAPLLLFGIGNYVTSIPMSIYMVYEVLKDFGRMTGVTVVFHIGCSSHWIFYPVLVLVAFSVACGSTAKEVSMHAFRVKAVLDASKPSNANNTGNILHDMLSDRKSVGDTRELGKFNVLSLDLLQNRVSISLFGFFQLDDYFIYGIMAMAVTYFTIMLQL